VETEKITAMHGLSDTHIKGAIAVSSLGTVSGALYGLTKGANPLTTGVSTGFNSGIAAFTFFGVRDYLITPMINSTSGSPQVVVPSRAPGGVGENVLDSTCAGAVTGALLNGIRFGRGRVATGAGAWALTGAVLQLAYNEASRVRISYARNHQDAQEEEKSSSTGDVERSQMNASDAIMGIITWIAPVKKITDEEYLEAMKKQQAAVEKRLAQSNQARSKVEGPINPKNVA